MQDWGKIALAFFLAVCVGYGISWHNNRVDSAYERGFSEAVTESQVAYEADKEQAKKASDKLARDNNQLMKEKDDKIHNIESELSATVDRLRNERKSRSSASEGSNTASSDSPSCTGRELYGEDAEFLVREAARAEKVREERDYYYSLSVKIKNQIEEFYGKD